MNASEYQPQRQQKIRTKVLIPAYNDGPVFRRSSSLELLEDGYSQSQGRSERYSNSGDSRSSGGRVVVKQSRSGQTHGYESDSTDSGYVVSRGSQRIKRRRSSGPRPIVDDRYLSDGQYGQKSVTVRRQSVTSVKNSASRKHSGARGMRRNSASRDFEMWSNDTQGHRNQGYQSDSFV